MIVTHSAGGDIYTLDEKPARGAYLDRLGAPEDAYTDSGRVHGLRPHPAHRHPAPERSGDP